MVFEWAFPGIRAQEYDLAGQVAVVTGSTSGIGLETAKGLYLSGAHVIIAARNPSKAAKTIEEIKHAGSGKANVGKLDFIALDMHSLRKIDEFVSEFKSRQLPCNILYNNAGVAIPDDATTDDGFEVQLGTNFFGAAHLTQLMLPVLRQSKPARICWTTSVAESLGAINWDDLAGVRAKHSDFKMYCCSKLMDFMYAKDLATRLKEDGIHVYCAQPGITNTEMTSPKKSDVFKPWVWALTVQAWIYGLPTKTGAIPLYHVAAAPADKLISAAAGEHYGPWYFRPPLWPLEMPVITNALWLAHQKALNPLVHDAAACRRLVDDTNRLLMLGGPKGLGITPHNGAKH